tara:strand:+ start:211 stop:966 length:756 start_codon:yes stop_codon:yes gene_type:complete
MSEMKLIMENWRSYQEQDLLIEACKGSDCLQEYTVKDFIDDIGNYTGAAKKLTMKIQQAMASNPDDHDLASAAKRVLKQLGSGAAGGAIGLGLGAALGSVVAPGAGTAVGATAGAALGPVIAAVVQETLQTSGKALHRMFLDSQVEDPPESPRGWILDLKDEIESLVKGGSSNSPLYRQFSVELVKEFERVEQQINNVLGTSDLPDRVREQILESPIGTYMTKGTASQMLQNYINNHNITKDVNVSHPEVK